MALNSQYSERRFYTRFQHVMDASIFHEDTAVHGEITNISLKGIHIKASSLIPPGTTVKVIVFPSQKTELSFSGTVVRVDKAGLGVEISKIPVESFSYIRDLIVSRSSSPANIWDEVLKVISYLN